MIIFISFIVRLVSFLIMCLIHSNKISFIVIFYPYQVIIYLNDMFILNFYSIYVFIILSHSLLSQFITLKIVF